MTLVDTSIGDTGELGVVELFDGSGTTVAHTRAQTTYHLIDHLLHRSLVRHTASDALGHQFLHLLGVALEVTVLRTVLLLHGLERTHTTIRLELTTVVDDRIARTLLGTCHERAHHHATATSGQGLHDIARIAQTTISDKGNTRALEHTIHVVDGTELGHTHTSHHTGGTDRTRTNTHLDSIGTVINEHLGSLASSNITNNDIDIGEHLLGFDEFLDHRLRVTMGSIDDDSVGTSINESLHTVEGISSHTHTSGHTQTTLLVLTGHGLILGFGDILIGDKSDQTVILIYYGQFLDFVLLQDLCGSHQISLLMGGYEIILRHDFLDRTIQTTLEAQVTVGDDTHEVLLIVDHGDTTDMILRHDVEGLSHGRT